MAQFAAPLHLAKRFIPTKRRNNCACWEATSSWSDTLLSRRYFRYYRFWWADSVFCSRAGCSCGREQLFSMRKGRNRLFSAAQLILHEKFIFGQNYLYKTRLLKKEKETQKSNSRSWIFSLRIDWSLERVLSYLVDSEVHQRLSYVLIQSNFSRALHLYFLRMHQFTSTTR